MQLGITAQLWSRWELRDELPVDRINAVAAVLNVPLEKLNPLARMRAAGRPVKVVRVSRHTPHIRAMLADRCPLDDMLTLGPLAFRLHGDVLARLGASQYAEFDSLWHRDTRHEFLIAHHILANASAERHTLHELGCPLLVVREDTFTYGGDEVHFAPVWGDGTETIIFFSQVRVRTPENGNLYRVDVLVNYRKTGEPPEWLYLELDGDAHDFTPEKDKQRTRDLRLPCIRCENAAALNPRFFTWLVWQIRERLRARREWRVAQRQRQLAEEKRDKRRGSRGA